MQAMEAENGHQIFTFAFTFSFAYLFQFYVTVTLISQKTDELHAKKPISLNLKFQNLLITHASFKAGAVMYSVSLANILALVSLVSMFFSLLQSLHVYDRRVFNYG